MVCRARLHRDGGLHFFGMIFSVPEENWVDHPAMASDDICNPLIFNYLQ